MILKTLLSYLNSFFELIYPSICNACGNHLYEGEKLICVECRMTLPYTNDWEENVSNTTAKLFWGRVPIKAASSYLFFRKKSGVQKILHQLKYHHHEKLGNLIGRMHASQLLEHPDFSRVHTVMPIPLHPKKFRERGYNQAELLAQGYADVFQVKLDTFTLQRGVYTSSQTRKSRYQRYENMKDVFFVKNVENVRDKNILIVDDVITTGATLEAAAQKLLDAGAAEIYIASIAVAP